MRILLLGYGQLGKSIYKKLSGNYKIIVYSKKNKKNYINYLNHSNFQKIIKHNKPDIIINCIAFTNVDECERKKKIANKINFLAVKRIADLSQKYNCLLIHFSTDYVFDGKKKNYTEKDKTKPINYYGLTKLRADKYIIKKIRKYFIFRVSWLYSSDKKNFFSKIRKKIYNQKDFSVTNKEYGTPNSTIFISSIISKFLKKLNQKKFKNIYGLYNISSNGIVSRYQLAKFIQKSIKKKSLYLKIYPNSYKSVARRPFCSNLSPKKVEKTLKIKMTSWQFNLKKFIRDNEF